MNTPKSENLPVPEGLAKEIAENLIRSDSIYEHLSRPRSERIDSTKNSFVQNISGAIHNELSFC